MNDLNLSKTYFKWLSILFEYQCVLGNEIGVAVVDSFGQSRRPRTKQTSGSGILCALLIVESYPIFFAVSEQGRPGLISLGDLLAVDIENQYIGAWCARCCCSFFDGSKQLRL